jgi:hypothetical protein
MNDTEKTAPRVSQEMQPFWEGCGRHELRLPFCMECGKAHLPAGPVCPFCFSERLVWRRASGRGRISTWVRVHKEWFPAFREEIPYNVVQVELEEGPRLTADVVGIPAERLRVGLPVVVDFKRAQTRAGMTLPRFTEE